MSVSRAILCVTGLLKPHVTNTGLVQLYRNLRTRIPPTSQIELYRWRDYNKILMDLASWKPSSVIFIGHSYGVSTSLFACETIQKHWPHVRISHLISTDGVWRERADQIDTDSLRDNHKLVVPTNVLKLHSFRQCKGPIRGHDFIVSEPTVWETNAIVAHPKHARMDRLPLFIDLAKRLVLG